MRQMFQEIINHHKREEDLVMVTVVASSGATPRGAGARMLIGKEGRICGTIGGGAVEYRAEGIAAQVLEEKQSREHDFSLTRDDVENLGMICGGAVNVYFTFLSAEDKELTTLAEHALLRFAQGQELWLLTDIIHDGKLSLFSKEAEIPATDGFKECINTAGKVYIFGGGHVAQELVPVLARTGFRCVVLEDRLAFTKKEQFPDAEEIILADFEHIADKITLTSDDYTCVMTRGHAFDTIIQAQILKTPACYIGVIGSAHKKAGVYQVLYSMGFTEADTDRITSPIGLDILAETPAEIAISIAGQLIEHRARRKRL